MGSELFSGDIMTAPIPEDGLYLAPEMTLLVNANGERWVEVSGETYDEWEVAFETFRDLFKRQADTTLERVKQFVYWLLAQSVIHPKSVAMIVERIYRQFPELEAELLEGQSKETG